MIQESKFVVVDDDWYGNYDGNKVKVKIRIVPSPHQPFVRISVWGNDDFGMDMDFIGTDEENLAKYYEWKEKIYDKIPEPCNQEYFKSLGFTVF